MGEAARRGLSVAGAEEPPAPAAAGASSSPSSSFSFFFRLLPLFPEIFVCAKNEKLTVAALSRGVLSVFLCHQPAAAAIFCHHAVTEKYGLWCAYGWMPTYLINCIAVGCSCVFSPTPGGVGVALDAGPAR